jgi:putative transposase
LFRVFKFENTGKKYLLNISTFYVAFIKSVAMPLSQQYLASIEASSFYHIICRAIEGKKLFQNDDNRIYFLNKYQELSGSFVDTYAYSLLDNHVHWLVKSKPQDEIFSMLTGMPQNELTATHKKFISQQCSFHELIEQQFNRLFIGYALALNKQQNTKGHLFNRPFKRIEVKDNNHLTQLFVYIHANVMKHGLMKDFTQHKWSSYRAIISAKPTHVKREEVLEWFGGSERFITAHKEMSDYFYDHPLGGE